ncbi:hypothetical protein ACFL4U_03000 [Candidatus Neomarinimicrobiota bacterium]
MKAVENSRKINALRIYLDCHRCDADYIRTEITFVNYVRDRKDAQVHILITTQRTASGGSEYTITYIGQQEFSGQDDVLQFVANEFDTDYIVRESLARTLKLGLIRYVAQTPLADQIDISYKQEMKPIEVLDKWDSWVFRVGLNNRFDGETQKNSIDLNGSISADRITPELKIRLSLYGSYDEENYFFDDSTVSSFQRSASLTGQVVKSISEHWSIGVQGRANSSSYRNIQQETILAPAVEYNLFPYSESTRRELRFLYTASYNPVDYIDTTIFSKTSEKLLRQSLDITLEMKETWGSIRVSLDGSHYFHDRGLYRVALNGNVELYLFKGLSLDLFGNISKINDQLSLLKRDFSTEEILLGTSQLATDFEYGVSMGLSYTFGSIYSNVVNPRFGNGRRSHR